MIRVHASLDIPPAHLLLGRIWALRENATAYDAAYLALAETLIAKLVATDPKLADVPGHGAGAGGRL